VAYDPIPDLAQLIEGMSGLRAVMAQPASCRALLGELLKGPYARLRGGLLLDEPGRENVSTEQAVREALAEFIAAGGKLAIKP
jgi:hypothetical protein